MGLFDDAVDGLLVHAEERCEGALWRGEPLIDQSDGGAVFQGEERFAPGAGSRISSVAAALVKCRATSNCSTIASHAGYWSQSRAG